MNTFNEPASFTEPDLDAPDICEECGARTENDCDAVDGMCGDCADEAHNNFEDPEED